MTASSKHGRLPSLLALLSGMVTEFELCDTDTKAGKNKTKTYCMRL